MMCARPGRFEARRPIKIKHSVSWLIRRPGAPQSYRPAAAGSRAGKSNAAHTLPLPRRLSGDSTPATHVYTARADSRATDRAARSRRDESLRSTSGHGVRRPARTATAVRHDRGAALADGRRRLPPPVRERPVRNAPTVRGGSHRGDPALRDPCRWNGTNPSAQFRRSTRVTAGDAVRPPSVDSAPRWWRTTQLCFLSSLLALA